MVIANDPVMMLGQMVNAVLISDTTAKVNSILCLLIIGA